MPEQLHGFMFASGTMGPKVEAACRFVERTGHTAAIGAMDQAVAVLVATAGTVVYGNIHCGMETGAKVSHTRTKSSD